MRQFPITLQVVVMRAVVEVQFNVHLIVVLWQYRRLGRDLKRQSDIAKPRRKKSTDVRGRSGVDSGRRVGFNSEKFERARDAVEDVECQLSVEPQGEFRELLRKTSPGSEGGVSFCAFTFAIRESVYVDLKHS